jgi:hypothetical protein
MPAGMQAGPSGPPLSIGPPSTQPAPPVVHVPHCPQPSHVWYEQGPHCCVLWGVHTGVCGHEQAPHAQLEVQYCVPYVLHACDWVGAHTPWLLQLPLCQ